MNYSTSDVEMFGGDAIVVHKDSTTARTLGHEGNQQENMERMW